MHQSFSNPYRRIYSPSWASLLGEYRRAGIEDSSEDDKDNPTARNTVEEDNDSREQKEDRKYRHKKHLAQVRHTISADRTGDSVFERTAQKYQAVLPTSERGQESKDQQETSSHDYVEEIEATVPGEPVLTIPKRLEHQTPTNHALQDYQMQLMLLDQQNKKRLQMEREQKNAVSRSVFGLDPRFSNSEAGAGFAPHSALSKCIHSISDVLDSLEGYNTADLSALKSNLESLQTSLLEPHTTKVLPSPEPRYQMIYRVNAPDIPTRMYLDQPQWIEGEVENSGVLMGNLVVQNIQQYLERHPEVCFVIYRDFSVPESGQKDANNTSSVPKHNSETIETPSTNLKSAVTKFIQFCGFAKDATGGIDALGHHSIVVHGLTELSAPYPAFYHGSSQDIDPFLKSLDYSQEKQFRLLFDYVLSHYGDEYGEVKRIIDSGRITKRCFKYIFKPGDVVVQKEASEARGFLCSSWVTDELIEDTDEISSKDKASKTRYTITAHHWTFDDVFSCKSTVLEWEVDANNDSKLETDGLRVCPLAFVDRSLADKLRRRGARIWKCRTKCLVSYHEDSTRESHYSDDERYMIDMAVYYKLHKSKKNGDSTQWNYSEHSGTDDLGQEAMKRDDPPSTEFLYLLPMAIKGFNLRKKKWVDLKVDNIGDVVWNEIAFERLVLEEKTKRLIRALVSEQIETTRSTDIISGKGNGLIMLLHGGPGTGKTLTAESVAEIARKPLYPVTCGDIGTEPEEVENYLESVLHLGKTWECVVLLDEADVFLEQRSLQDLHRNALVSVFLRVLEYYEGILILTSNRVGTFDEAFKSRIQLAIHYSNLSFYQRTEIWKNFISRLEDLEEEEMDAADLKDNIENLAQFKMNGREIRNAITNARQYTRWERKQQRNQTNCKLDYSKMKLIIDTSIKFDDYIKELNGGYETVAVDEGLRAEQKKKMSTSKEK
ncbi:hypothetical protein F4811DRAFT_527151 [Daldinia bambusicola]|nr:hypothetical protein F4811DRAFT_527151 [Daldinia bambusicola]